MFVRLVVFTYIVSRRYLASCYVPASPAEFASLGNFTLASGWRPADLRSNAAGTSRQPELCRTQVKAWRSWPDSYRSRPVRAAATTSAPWCCSPFRALPGASSAWPLSGWTRPLLPPTRLLPNPGTDGFCQGRLRVYINRAPLTRSGCPTVTDGLDRFQESQILLRRVGGRPPTFPPAYGRREAEPHQSRTVSLGIGQIAADKAR